tara:strand:- start:29 stop:199 length:171 start_codon:yes stop_codon:yes gene_type:complete
MNKLKNWYREHKGFVLLLSGIAILLAALLNGESFGGQIPFACVLVIAGVVLTDKLK